MTYTPDERRHERIPFRLAGASGLDLPSISFGLWQKFGSDDTQREIILHAFASV
jgi:L-glyceraldehyde 3-phosphate reductase